MRGLVGLGDSRILGQSARDHTSDLQTIGENGSKTIEEDVEASRISNVWGMARYK